MRLTIVLCLSFLGFSPLSSGVEMDNETRLKLKYYAEQLRYYTENYPPANYLDNNQLIGVSVDTLDLIWQKLQLTPKEISVLPWVRGYRELRNNPNTVLFTMSKTKSRTPLFKWVGPVFSSTHVLVAKQSKNFNFEAQEQMYDFRVATVRGDISETSLIEFGFPRRHMTNVPNLKQAFLMLRNDRVDMVMVSIHGLHHLLADMHESRSKYQIVWQVNKIGNYFAFHPNTPDIVVDSFQSAFEQLGPERLQILQKYKIPEEEY